MPAGPAEAGKLHALNQRSARVNRERSSWQRGARCVLGPLTIGMAIGRSGQVPPALPTMRKGDGLGAHPVRQPGGGYAAPLGGVVPGGAGRAPARLGLGADDGRDRSGGETLTGSERVVGGTAFTTAYAIPRPR